MKFKIAGADRDTGEDVELVVDAPDERAALISASKRHLLVSACTPVPASKPSQPAPEDRRPPSALRRVAVFLTVLLVVGAAAMAVLYWGYAKTAHEAYQRTAAEAEDREEHTKTMIEQGNQQRIAELERKAATAKAEVARQQLRTERLKTFADQCEPFVREAKALRARVDRGLTVQALDEKVAALVEKAALVGRAPEDDADALELKANLEGVVDDYSNVLRFWQLVVRNASVSPMNLHRDDIERRLEDAGVRVGQLVASYDAVSARAK